MSESPGNQMRLNAVPAKNIVFSYRKNSIEFMTLRWLDLFEKIVKTSFEQL